MSEVFTRIMLEITADDAPLCDEYGDSIFDEAGNDIYLEQVGFVDVYPDYRQGHGLNFDYGIRGNKVKNRVGDRGAMSFRLDNSASNRAGLLGYYSPDHANFLGGWEKETPVKLTFEYNGVRYVKWRGLTKKIQVEPYITGARFVDVECEDYMVLLDEFTEINLQAIQLNITSDELYETIEGLLQRRFPSTTFAANPNTLTYGFDTATKQKATARNEINKIAMSVFDYVFIKGDTYEGAHLTSQTFANRVTDQTNDFTLTEASQRFLEPERTEKIDRAKAMTHPRVVGTEDEVLFSMSVTAGQAQSMYPGGSITFTADYRDPNQDAERVAARSLTAQVASTDYKFGRGNGDGSEDLNSSVTISISPAGGGVTSSEITLTNNHATYTAHVNAFQLKGKIIRQFQPIESVVEVADALGDKEITVDLAYEDSAVAGESIADLIRAIYQDAFTQISAATYLANKDATRMGYAMSVEPGMRGAISETVTGISQNAFVQHVSGRLFGNEMLEMTYLMDMAQPASGNFWLAGTAGHSEAALTTYAFGV